MDEKAYWTSEVAEMLGVATVTIRSWAQRFEAKGYRFIRDEKGNRAFRESDVIAFKHYIELTKVKGISQDIAIDAVITKHSAPEEKAISPIDTKINELITRYEERYQSMSDKLDLVLKQNAELLARLDEREERDEQRQRQITEFITAYRENAASRQEQSFWSRLFRRN